MLPGVAELVGSSKAIVVLSGAGLSKASGIPTYRDAAGLWRSAENLKYSHTNSYRDAPDEFMLFWQDLGQKLLQAKPNSGHFALAELQRKKSSTVLITQNIDGLLQVAGCTRVLELHGSIRRLQCEECGLTSEYRLDRCLRCGGHMRPAVVLFGESLDELTLSAAQAAANNSDLMILVGTRAEVYPAAFIPFLAMQNNAKLIVLDTEQTEISSLADFFVRGNAEELLPKLIKLSS